MTLLKLILILVLSLLVVVPAYAQKEETYFEKSLDTYQKEKYGGDDGELHKTRFDATTVNNIVNEITTMSIGTTEKVAQETGVSKPGAIGYLNHYIAYMVYRPPVTSGEYLADLGKNIGLPIRSVYAQDVGWQALQPVLKIWKGFRNVAYIGFVIIFMVTGLMIMMRAKINPQTVISIESALPKVVITLILITFSYAIAGLMIDLIYVLIYLIVNVFVLGGVITDADPPIQKLLNRNPFTIVFSGPELFIQAPGEAIQGFITNIFGTGQENPFWQTFLFESFGGLAKAVIAIVVIISLFKLFFSLIICYLTIIISVIFAPLNLLMNAFPGSNAFSAWFKNLFANIIVFPAVAGIFLIGAVLIGPRNNATGCNDQNNPWCVAEDVGFYPNSMSGEVWVPPMLVLGEQGTGGSVQNFMGLISLGIIMMAPQVVVMIKKMLKVEAGGFGGAIMGGIMAGPKLLTAAPGTAFDLLHKGSYMGIGPFRNRGMSDYGHISRADNSKGGPS